MKNRFDIPYGSIVEAEQERVIKNAMIIDPFANVEVFTDLTPIHMAVIQSRIGKAGVLLALSEPSQDDAIIEGHRVELAFSPYEVTKEQKETLAAISKLEIEEGESLPKELAKTSKAVLPSLWFSDIVFTADGLRFRNGNRHSHFTSALEYITRTIRDAQAQAHRESNVQLRAQLADEHGVDMSRVLKPELSEQRRQRELDEISPEYSLMLAKAQELQLYSFDLPSPQFVVEVAKAHLANLG